jgi:hypothetical protein
MLARIRIIEHIETHNKRSNEMKQQRLEVPQRTLYGVHRPARFYNRDPHSNVPFNDTVPPMQQWEKVGWSIIAGLLFGFVAFGGFLGFPW